MKALVLSALPALLAASLFAAAPQAPRPPQAPAVQKADAPAEKPAAKKPPLSLLVLSKSGCVPCARLAAELKANGDDLEWDIWKDAPGVEAKYGGVSLYPTILLVKGEKEVARRIGYASVDELSRWMDEVAATAD